MEYLQLRCSRELEGPAVSISMLSVPLSLHNVQYIAKAHNSSK